MTPQTAYSHLFHRWATAKDHQHPAWKKWMSSRDYNATQRQWRVYRAAWDKASREQSQV